MNLFKRTRDEYQLFAVAIHVAFLWLGFVATPAVRAAEFGVRGNISVELLGGGGVVVTNYSFPFIAAAKDDSWHITVSFARDHYLSTGCDGTNVYDVLHDPNMSRLLLNTPVQRGTNTSSAPVNTPLDPGMVSEGYYPYNEEWYVTLPWLAYCSTAFLDRLGTTNLPAPWASPRIDPTSSIYSMAVERTKTDPALLTSAAWTVHDEFKKKFQHLNWLRAAYREPSELTKLDFYKDGFVGGDYKVTQWTNSDGVTLPQAFELKRYDPQLPTRVAVLYRGFITEVFRPDFKSYAPQITNNVSVSDFRFQNASLGIDYIHYPITNGVWIADKPAGLQAIFEMNQKSSSQNKLALALGRSRGFKGWTAMGVIIVTLLLPLVFMVSQRRKNRQLNQG